MPKSLVSSPCLADPTFTIIIMTGELLLFRQMLLKRKMRIPIRHRHILMAYHLLRIL